jgi:hypothetical protein
MLSPSDIRPTVREVLLSTNNSLSAYQILDRLPPAIRDQIIAERGLPGAGSGSPFTSASMVTSAVQGLLPALEPPYRVYMEVTGMTFTIAGQTIVPGNPTLAFYYLPNPEPTDHDMPLSSDTETPAKKLPVKVDPKDYGKPMTIEEFEAKYGKDHGLTVYVSGEDEDYEPTPEEFEAGQRFVSRAGEDLPEIIVEAGVEGGGFTVYGDKSGQETDGIPRWIFCQEATTMELDDHDEEVWRTSRSEGTTNLSDVCPTTLFHLFPTYVHPKFAAWFREQWNDAVEKHREAIEWREQVLKAWDRVIAVAEQEEETPEAETNPGTIAPSHSLSDAEYAVLFVACRNLPPAKTDYRIHNYVENLLLTVTDFQLHTKVVIKAMQHFKTHTQQDATDLAGLKAVLGQYPDDKEGNTNLAQCLWGYNLWTRAEILRRLVGFFETEGVTDQASLVKWATEARFRTHFQGRVKGLGYAVFNWLIMRQGVETIKPDVHVLRFVQNAVGRPVKETVAVEALMRVAHEIGIPAYKLDWAIWEAGVGNIVP